MSSKEQQDNNENVLNTVLSEDDHACPICLCSPSDELLFLSGDCGHEVCQPCMERMLLSPRDDVPTRGKCPICRSTISLFHLRENDNKVAYPKDFDVENSSLAGSIYEGRDPSFHFDERVPYLRFEEKQYLDSGTPLPQNKPFDDGYHWHAKTHTFHGSVTWTTADNHEDTYYGAHRWDIILQFSSDFRFVSNGILERRCIDQPTRFPLDGTWIVTWTDTGAHDLISIHRNKFRYGGLWYKLDLTPNSVSFEWPVVLEGRPPHVVQSTEFDFESHPCGPAVGEELVWKTEPPLEQITWTRETTGMPKVKRFGPTQAQYRRRQASTETTRPVYCGDNLYGNTFCQGLKVGLASYHFVLEESYISYEHPLCAQWPPLDDGTPIPSRVFFRNATFSSGTFRGTIEWQEEFSTTWQGCSRWIYEIKFDSQYTCIVSGVVNSIVHGEEQEMSVFGADLVYINAAIEEKFNNEISQGEESAFERYREMSTELRSRLQDEGASVRTIAMMHHVLSSRTEHNLVDFNL